MRFNRRISGRGQIVLPRDARKAAGIKPNSSVNIDAENGAIIIRPGKSGREFVEEFVNPPGKKLKHLTIAQIKKTLEEEYEIH